MENSNIHQRINKIMSEWSYVQKTQPKKSASGGDGLGYSHVKHDDVTKALHPFLVKYGINIIPTVTESKLNSFNVTAYNYSAKKEVTKTVYSAEVVVAFRLVNIDNPADFIESSWLGFGLDTQDKAVGKACSYAYKTMALKTFALETGDEDIEQDREDYLRTESSLVGHSGIDADIRREATDIFFEQAKAALLEFETLDKMSAYWIKNWKHISSMPKAQTQELINIKDNMKLKFEGKI